MKVTEDGKSKTESSNNNFNIKKSKPLKIRGFVL